MVRIDQIYVDGMVEMTAWLESKCHFASKRVCSCIIRIARKEISLSILLDKNKMFLLIIKTTKMGFFY